MNDIISPADKQILRNLAQKQAELAASPDMATLTKRWYAHNLGKIVSPIITIETGTFANEMIEPLLQCTSEHTRQIEFELISQVFNYLYFKDDVVVKNYFPVVSYPVFKPFDLDVVVEHTEGIGHHFKEQIIDLQQDYHKLKKSVYSDTESVCHQRKAELEDLFGDLLPVKIIGASYAFNPTQYLVHLMSMENIFFAMYDYPELFYRAMMSLADDYIEMLRYMESKQLIRTTAEGEMLCNGSYCYRNDFVSEPAIGVNANQIWGFMDSQETVGVDPDMFKELVFPSYKKVGEQFAQLSYGCCEPVDPIWENCLSEMKNLKKLSISAWCNEERIGECLSGTGIIYHRKPSPNFIGVDITLNEDALRKHFKKTVQSSKNCPLEISQRDVYTVHSNVEKVRRYVQIAREECEAHC